MTQPVVSPSRVDPVVRSASEVVGGPAGRRLSSATGFWRAVPVLVVMAIAMIGLAGVQKQHCRAQGWSTPDQFWHACYSDIAVLYGSSALGGPDRPGLTEAVGQGGLGQPPLASAAMWLVSALVPGDTTSPERRFFDFSALLLAVALAVGVMAVAVAAGRRRWDAAHLAVSPVLVTAGLVSYELLAVALVGAALLAWKRERWLVSGVLLGLAVAAAPATAGVGVAMLAVAIRAERARSGVIAVAAGLVTWFGVRIVLLPGVTGGLGAAWRDWKDSAPGYGSTWLIPQLVEASRPARHHNWLADWWFGAGSLAPSTATALALLAIIGVIVMVSMLVLMAPQPPALAPVALVAVAGFLAASKSLPVQACLLLLPLIALSGMRWRDHLIWATAELAYFVAVWLYIGAQSDPNRGLPASFYVCFLLARLAAMGWIGLQAGMAAYGPRPMPAHVAAHAVAR